jgi:hypothetical protein
MNLANCRENQGKNGTAAMLHEEQGEGTCSLAMLHLITALTRRATFQQFVARLCLMAVLLSAAGGGGPSPNLAAPTTPEA